MPSDSELINFGEDHELNSVLKHFGLKESEGNRKVLTLIGDACKKENNVRILKRDVLYAYAPKHKYFENLVKKA